MECSTTCSAPSQIDPLLQGLMNFAMTIPGAVLFLVIAYLSRELYRWYQRSYPLDQD